METRNPRHNARSAKADASRVVVRRALIGLGVLPLLAALGLSGCYRPNIGACPPGADCAPGCSQDSDCAGGEVCQAGAVGLVSTCVPPSVTCAGLPESDCSASPGCQAIYVAPPCAPDAAACPETYDHCVTVTTTSCAQIAGEGDCDARPDCEWVVTVGGGVVGVGAQDGGVAQPLGSGTAGASSSSAGTAPSSGGGTSGSGGSTSSCTCNCPAQTDGTAAPCDCFCGGGDPVPTPAPGYCQDRQPDTCPPDQRTPGGCLGCGPDQVVYNQTDANGITSVSCQKSCNSDSQCGAGSICTTDHGGPCLNPCPNNPAGGACECLGVCQPAPVDCSTLDQSTCGNYPQCQLKTLYPPCACNPDPNGNCQPCGPIYECVPVQPMGCAGKDEASCLADSSCTAEYGGVGCGCPANDPTCACTTGGGSTGASDGGTACGCPANDPTCDCAPPPPPSDGYLGCVDNTPPVDGCNVYDEAACKANFPCMATYTGSDCTCDVNDVCTCNQLTFTGCQYGGPTPAQPQPQTGGGATR
jgi:hypothetical protein